MQLPGRTDNEIKNFWNTRTKRKERAGLPIYPPEICSQVINENQQNNMNTFSAGSGPHLDFMPNNSSGIPPVEFKNPNLKQECYDYPPSSLMSKTLGHSYRSILSTIHPAKRLKSKSPFLGLTGTIGSFMPCVGPYQNAHPFIMSSSTYEDNSTYNHEPTVPSGSHSSLNSNLSTSQPAWASNRELPSFQKFSMGNWGGSPSSPLPPTESVDILIQTPPIEQPQTESCNLLPRDSGLLEAVLYEANTITNSSVSDAHDVHASDMAINMIDASPHHLHEKEWEGFGGSISSLCHSPLSVFNDHNPLDEPQLGETAPGLNLLSQFCLDRSM